MIYEAALALAAVALLRHRGYDVASLLPRPSWRGTGVGVLLGIAAVLVSTLARLPFLAVQAEQPIARMMQHSTIGVPMLLLLAGVNGTFEEVFLLGFLMRGLRHHGLSISLGVMLLVRISYHLYQGPLGAVSVLGFGLVFGLYHARTQRLWPPVLAHMMWDVIPFLL